ncbi:hypothetical protein [Cerasicoccus arenae]|uniref:Uncharacterized protein n=1 Tax=Cerasicoccus arenae TaxID=424488 RepID=A0A8J3DHU9_9BACT|nr:hypothetical protein [Cerasicoccus arenae]MBK1858254.1 hypothetical protein [Cerasicoccus arenae]GHC02193.1 hypothetical protein GCM10007047_18400 [Cerasicoccus arenae]
MNKQFARLRIPVHDDLLVSEFTSILTEYAIAYTSVRFFMTAGPEHEDRMIALRFSYEPFLPHEEEPRLGRVMINSPGFWEIIGDWNPMKLIADYLKHRDQLKHERRFDGATRRGMDLDNLLKENEVIRERIEILQSVGFSKAKIRDSISQYLEQPLERTSDISHRMNVGTPELINEKGKG